MKIFKYIALVGAAVSSQLSHRNRRDATFSLSGDENPDQLMDILTSISGGTSDDLEAAIMAFMGVDRLVNEIEMRKFRQLKIVVLWLQKEQKFGRYCYYGCYCLPEGSHNIASGGYGKPLDPIDRACMDFKNCYKCLVDEHTERDDGCRGEEIGYRMDLLEDPNTGEKSVECTNTVNSCRYNICQCDKALAEKLAMHEDSWDENLHTVKGGFVREDNCYRGTGGAHTFEECCGDKTTFPFNQPRRSNQCCDGYMAKAAGSC